jgi:signal transduction histidine kinase
VARGVWPDLLIAALLGAIGVLALLRAQAAGTVGLGQRGPDAVAYLLVALQTVPLCWRRRAPLAVLAVVLPAASAFWLLGYPDARSDLAAPLAFYTVASRLPPGQVVRAAAIVAVSLYVLVAAGRAPADTFLVLHVVYGGAWVLGDTVRRRGERIIALQREQQLRIRQAIVEERVRIAQEVHDLATHALGVIAIQAQAGTRALEQRPEQTKASLAAVADLADEALTDLRKLLGFLRSDELDARRPQPTLDSLEPLADGFRRAGLPVRISTEGPRRPLTGALQTSAYRVVKEALTNTLKHAGPATAQVAIRYGDNVLEVEVVDTGRGPARTVQPGNGLAGMRERVGVFGGELTYGARAQRGFAVTARMPITEPPGRADPPP